jgi:hypothetical protein
VRFLVPARLIRAQLLAIAATADGGVELHAGDGKRRLQQHVAHAGPQPRRVLQDVFARVGVLELEPDDEQADAERPALGGAIGRRCRAADEHGGVREGWRRRHHEH